MEELGKRTRLDPYGFTPNEGSFLHAKFWRHYTEDEFFKFWAIRSLIGELFFQTGCPCVYFGKREDGIREEYVGLSEGYKFALATENAFSPAIKLTGKMNLDVEYACKIIQVYRRRARLGFTKFDYLLRSVQMLMLNLPDEPRFFVKRFKSDHSIVIQVVWKDWFNRDCLTIKIWDKTHLIL